MYKQLLIRVACQQCGSDGGARECGGCDIDFRLDAGNATFPLFSSPTLAFSPSLATFITTSCCLKVFHVYGNVTQLDFEISRQYLLSPLSSPLCPPLLLHYAGC